MTRKEKIINELFLGDNNPTNGTRDKLKESFDILYHNKFKWYIKTYIESLDDDALKEIEEELEIK